jgi:acetolactate synthase-1/2/3 large subunit
MSIHQTVEAKDIQQAAEIMSGAEIVVRGLVDQGVDTLFGYPGGAVLPIYDALFHEPRLQHILVRHEQGATHAAEGYARTRASRAWSWSPRVPARPTPSPASWTP